MDSSKEINYGVVILCLFETVGKIDTNMRNIQIVCLPEHLKQFDIMQNTRAVNV